MPILEAFDWVLDKIGEVSRVVRLSFEGVEQEAWALFAKLENRCVSREGEVLLPIKGGRHRLYMDGGLGSGRGKGAMGIGEAEANMGLSLVNHTT